MGEIPYFRNTREFLQGYFKISHCWLIRTLFRLAITQQNKVLGRENTPEEEDWLKKHA